eukprot:Hpha_TRINITY_DN28522_c0_g1::TRINITY_DN28522_c0_g1_i1::g.18581::m.18581
MPQSVGTSATRPPTEQRQPPEGSPQSGVVTKKGTFEFPEGHFEGSVRCLRHGWGRQAYSDGSRYEGEWQDDQFHGRGKLLGPRGDEYDGEWSEGMREGYGRWSSPEGD